MKKTCRRNLNNLCSAGSQEVKYYSNQGKKEYQLPVLNAVYNSVAKTGVPELGETLFICVQHFLYTSVTLFEKLIALGANPKHIFLLGKHYSFCKEVANRLKKMGIQIQPLTPLTKPGKYKEVFKKDISRMWKQVQKYLSAHKGDIQKIIILDEGGRCLEHLAEAKLEHSLPVIGIEQTTAGLLKQEKFCSIIPFIDVAASAAKIYLEPKMVTDVLWSKIKNKIRDSKLTQRYGVIGLGNIGKALVSKLISLNQEIFIYDTNADSILPLSIKDAQCCSSLSELVEKSNFIFGCTGKDVTLDLEIFKNAQENKTLVSCTSEDKEFLHLITTHQLFSKMQGEDVLKDIHLTLPNGKSINILKGGFPFNFDDSGVSVKAENIQLIRALLLCSIIQAAILLPQLSTQKITGRIMLDPHCQRFVVNEWLRERSIFYKKFNDIDWITENSKGDYFSHPYLTARFGHHRETFLGMFF